MIIAVISLTEPRYINNDQAVSKQFFISKSLLGIPPSESVRIEYKIDSIYVVLISIVIQTVFAAYT